MAYAMLAFTLKSFEKSHNQVMQFAPAVPDRRNRRPLITTLDGIAGIVPMQCPLPTLSGRSNTSKENGLRLAKTGTQRD